jgi:cytochrome oxidase Cu insertion factor (SCO1/SenC/PrrC family)
VFVLALVFSVAASAQQAGQPAAAQPLVTNVKIGDPAPDFTLPDHTGKQVKLSDFKGKKNVVLAFYVAAFTAG